MLIPGSLELCVSPGEDIRGFVFVFPPKNALISFRPDCATARSFVSVRL